jgi:hypothetical protein
MAVSVAGFASRAEAATPEPVALAWSAGDGCLDQKALAASVERTLGRPVFRGDGDPRVMITGAVGARKDRPGFEAKISMQRRGSEPVTRTLTADVDCHQLDDSVAVVVALMLDTPDEAPPVLRAPEHAPPEPPPRAHAAATFGLGGGVAVGLLPGVAGMALARVELRVPPLPPFLPASLTARLAAPSSTGATSAIPGGQAAGTFSAWDAELSLSPTLERERLRGGFAFAVGAGTLEGSGAGAVIGGTTRIRPLFLASLGAFGGVHLGAGFWLRADAGVLVPLVRDRWGFAAAGGDVNVFEPAPVAPVASLSLELRSGS